MWHARQNAESYSWHGAPSASTTCSALSHLHRLWNGDVTLGAAEPRVAHALGWHRVDERAPHTRLLHTAGRPTPPGRAGTDDGTRLACFMHEQASETVAQGSIGNLFEVCGRRQCTNRRSSPHPRRCHGAHTRRRRSGPRTTAPGPNSRTWSCCRAGTCHAQSSTANNSRR